VTHEEHAASRAQRVIHLCKGQLVVPQPTS
jgi:hypothetical protein